MDFVYCFGFPLAVWISSTGLGFVYLWISSTFGFRPVLLFYTTFARLVF